MILQPADALRPIRNRKFKKVQKGFFKLELVRSQLKMRLKISGRPLAY